ncbi:MAG: TonB-dependent receptor domain-containing protein [Methylococcales bacterium]
MTWRSVSIVGQGWIEGKQAQNFGEISQNLPNLDIAGGPRAVGNQVNIRGLSDDRILFPIDGARQNFNRAHNSAVFLDPDLLKQIEVVRGPASALWGSGALGGVVAFTTKDAVDLLSPGEQFGAKIKGGYQDVNNQWLGVNARNRARFQNFGPVKQLLGLSVDYFHNEAQGRRNGMRRDSFSDGQSDVTGLYIQDEFTLWKRLSVIPGLRWDRFESRASDASDPESVG